MNQILSRFGAMRTICLLSVSFYLPHFATAQKPAHSGPREYINIRIYHAADSTQLATTQQYFQALLLPALLKRGFAKSGAFKAIDSDTAKDKRLYIIVGLKSLAQLEKLNATIDETILDSVTVPAYTKALYNLAPYGRIENVLLLAFKSAPQVAASGARGALSERVYELRSYESATDALHQNKVKMFNDFEVALFRRLGFNAVFYGQVMMGSRMPNLMYMTSFDSKAARDEHWKNFGNDPEWKTMSAKPEYQHNVSKIEMVFLKALNGNGL